jgi:hypothetical protein
MALGLCGHVPPQCPLLPMLHSALRECMLALLPHRAQPLGVSPSPCLGLRCFYVIRYYKRDLPRAFCPHPHHCLPPVSPRRHTASVFRGSDGAKPSHPTSLPVRRSQSFLKLRSCFPNQEGDTITAVDRAGELRFSVTCHPRFALELSIMSGGFAMRLGFSQ